MPYGIVFQEFHQKWFNTFEKQYQKYLDRGPLLRMTWMMVAFLLGMAYAGNLKASLVIKSYEPRIKSLNEMIEKFV